MYDTIGMSVATVINNVIMIIIIIIIGNICT